MQTEVVTAALALRRSVVALDASLLTGDDCLALVEELARTEKAVAGARARLAARAAACGAHRRAGFRDPADWLARVSGSSLGDARAALDVGAAVAECPAAAEALAAGALSVGQAAEITRAEVAAPGGAAGLVELAARSGLGPVRDEARRRRLAAADPEELHARQHRARSFRHWRDAAGMVAFAGALTPEVGIPFVNRLEAECVRLRRGAGKQREREPFEARAADAFVSLVAGSGRGKAGRSDLVLVCDVRAWRRGHAHEGEPCHIVGGGPVPVRVARELAEDAFVKAVLHDGVAISTVAHFGRHIRAELRTALELGAPPEFGGTVCADGCGRRYGLDLDHVDPVANGGLTSFDNLEHRCRVDHWDKTERDRAAGLLGPGRPERAPPDRGAG